MSGGEEVVGGGEVDVTLGDGSKCGSRRVETGASTVSGGGVGHDE